MSELSHYIKLSSGLSGCDRKLFECDKYLDCDSCLEDKIKEHDKHVIEQYKADTEINDTIRDIHDNVAREMYCKGIDDFVIFIKKTLEHDWTTTKISEQIIYNRLFDECDRIAEELKAGVKYEV